MAAAAVCSRPSSSVREGTRMRLVVLVPELVVEGLLLLAV